MRVSPREQLPTRRGRQTRASTDAAARTVVARKGILATRIADIAGEAGRCTSSFYNYYDSKELMIREWAVWLGDEARQRSIAAAQPGLNDRERSYQATAAHWNTYRDRLAEIISVSQIATVSNDVAECWSEICSVPICLITSLVKEAQRQRFCASGESRLAAIALMSMLNQFCSTQLSGHAGGVDDAACIKTLADTFYRTIYHREDGQHG